MAVCSPEQLERSFGELHAQHPAAPGLLVAVEAPGLTWSAGFGRLSFEGPAMPANASVRIASVTKTFVAAATLRLVETGELALADPLAARVGEDLAAVLAEHGHDPHAMTIRHLLAHTSGLAEHSSLPEFQDAVRAQPQKRWTPYEQVALGAAQPPIGPPGARHSYSDTGYVLLGQVIERATGSALGVATRELLDLDVLGLRHTWWERDEPRSVDAGPSAAQLAGDVDSSAFDPSFDLFGGGGLVSQMSDLARFLRQLLNGRVLSPACLKLMTTEPDATAAAGWGHGLFRLPDSSGPWWGHTGFWGISMAWHAEHDLAVAMATTQLPTLGGVDVTSEMVRALS